MCKMKKIVWGSFQVCCRDVICCKFCNFLLPVMNVFFFFFFFFLLSFIMCLTSGTDCVFTLFKF